MPVELVRHWAPTRLALSLLSCFYFYFIFSFSFLSSGCWSFAFTLVIPLLTMLFFMYFCCPNWATFKGFSCCYFNFNVDLLSWSVIGLELVRTIFVGLDSTLPSMICNVWVLSALGLHLDGDSHFVILSDYSHHHLLVLRRVGGDACWVGQTMGCDSARLIITLPFP